MRCRPAYFRPLVRFLCFCLIAVMAGAMIKNTGYAQDGATGDSRVPLVLSDITRQTAVTAHTRWYVDDSRRLSIDDIRAMPDGAFTQSREIPSFGYSRDAIWYRLDFAIRAPLTQNLFMEVGPTFLNYIDAYLIENGIDAIQWQTKLGDHFVQPSGESRTSSHIAALPNLKPGSYRLYLRVQTNSTNLLYLSFSPPNALISSLAFRNLLNNIFSGFFLTLGIAYLSLGTAMRDSTVATYGIWVVSVGAVISIVNGFVLGHLQTGWPQTNDLLLGGWNATSQAATAFLWLQILDIRRTSPIFYKFACGYCLLVLACVFTATNQYYSFFGSYIVPSHSLFMMSMSAILIIRLLQAPKNPTLWLYLLILVVPTGPAVMLQLAHSGLIEATPLRLTLHQYTALFHMIAMGILMAIRLTRLDRERLKTTLRTAETASLVSEQRKLISMLSHEFRTPLAVIQRSSEMLMLRLKGKKPEILDRLGRIQMQARKLARLIDIFLNKDGIDHSDFSLAREIVALEDFMNEFVVNTSRENAEVTLRLQDTDGVEIFVDETLLSLAITNLIETSRRYAHGKMIPIVVTRLTNRKVAINISCQGSELNDEAIRSIDDALFRRNLESGAIRSALGLHISQRIAEAHDGMIRLLPKGSNMIALCLILPYDSSMS